MILSTRLFLCDFNYFWCPKCGSEDNPETKISTKTRVHSYTRDYWERVSNPTTCAQSIIMHVVLADDKNGQHLKICAQIHCLKSPTMIVSKPHIFLSFSLSSIIFCRKLL